jgi:peptidoglycan/xylan/chitin deacetylase (PgdA/CDA1 family)
MITLTFDNGPEPDVTPHVLDTLRLRGLRGTFFVLGRKLVTHRALTERAHGEGHWIGNHTFNHAVPLGLSIEPGAAVDEISRTEELIGNLAHENRLFRPYGGGGKLGKQLFNREACDHLVTNGYTIVLWNAIPEDWSDPKGWVVRALDQCLAQEETLIVLHDLPTGAMKDLDRFIGAAGDRGAVFRQEFPASCLPMIRGQAGPSLTSCVSDRSA